jgi:hypothetical protein
MHGTTMKKELNSVLQRVLPSAKATVRSANRKAYMWTFWIVVEGVHETDEDLVTTKKQITYHANKLAWSDVDPQVAFPEYDLTDDFDHMMYAQVDLTIPESNERKRKREEKVRREEEARRREEETREEETREEEARRREEKVRREEEEEQREVKRQREAERLEASRSRVVDGTKDYKDLWKEIRERNVHEESIRSLWKAFLVEKVELTLELPFRDKGHMRTTALKLINDITKTVTPWMGSSDLYHVFRGENFSSLFPSLRQYFVHPDYMLLDEIDFRGYYSDDYVLMAFTLFMHVRRNPEFVSNTALELFDRIFVLDPTPSPRETSEPAPSW